MAGFNQVFGGQNIFPAQLTYLALQLTEDIALQWPIEVAVAGDLVSCDIMDIISSDQADRVIAFPDARIAGPGQATLINNLSGEEVILNDFDGNEIGTVPDGEVWELYLTDNSTSAGDWETFQFGTGASSAVAAALAGAGLKAITNTLNVKILPRTSASSPLAIVNSDRARVVVWTGGVGAGTLPDPATVGSDWFVYLRNNGTGTWTITPAAGTINGAVNLALSPFGSTILYTDGANYYTIGLSNVTPTNFDFTAINVAGTGNYTLTGTELNRIAYRLTGALSGARNIIVPSTVQQYWVNNSTSGAFDSTVKTGAGSGVVVPQGTSMILYSDGTDVIAGEGTPGAGVIPIARGGTNIATYAQGDMLYASATNVLVKLTKDPNATRYLSNQGSNNDPLWDQINLSNGVKNRLPYFNIAQGSALSVLGVAGNAVADLASIVGTAGQVLRLNDGGTVLAFGAINLANAASVTGVLTVPNGGTGLATVAQGDLLYASAADTLARLAKNATFFKLLANTGASNGPAWLTPQFVGNVQISADYAIVLSDSWRIIYHDSATPHKATIPANGSIPFEIGSYFGFCNPSASGALTISITGPDTITGHGNPDGTGDFIVIPPGYSGYCIKVLSTWLLVTDAPSTVVTNITYRGYVGADGSTGNRFSHAGWSAVRNGTGDYTVTTGLGLADGTRLAVAGWPQASAGNRTSYSTSTNTGNTFNVGITDAGAGTASDQAFMFVAMVI